MTKCGKCQTCLKDEKDEDGWPVLLTFMLTCVLCGNKRCPHAENHIYKCSNSNELNQIGVVNE